MCVSLYVSVYMCVSLYMCVCLCICVSICISVSVCVCVSGLSVCLLTLCVGTHKGQSSASVCSEFAGAQGGQSSASAPPQAGLRFVV